MLWRALNSGEACGDATLGAELAGSSASCVSQTNLSKSALSKYRPMRAHIATHSLGMIFT